MDTGWSAPGGFHNLQPEEGCTPIPLLTLYVIPVAVQRFRLAATSPLAGSISSTIRSVGEVR